MSLTPIPQVQHNPIPPEVNSLSAFVTRLRAHFAKWPKGIVPIDKDDAIRLLDVVEATYAAKVFRPQTAADVTPPPAAQS